MAAIEKICVICVICAICVSGCGSASDGANGRERPAPVTPAPAPPTPTPPPPPWTEDGKPQHLPAIELEINDRRIRAEVARTDRERQKGLMFRTNLGDDEGMLFVFPRADFRNFWMRNTPLPLSIAYLADDGRITQISNMRPFDETLVYSREAVRYALEMHQGWFRAAGVREGDRVLGLERAPAAEE